MSDGSLAGYDSVEKILEVERQQLLGWMLAGVCCCAGADLPASPAHTHTQEHLPAEQLAAVKRVLYGANQGAPVTELELPKQAQQAAAEQGFDLQAYQFKAAVEQLRPARIVRIGLIQHGVVNPTTAPFLEQRQVCGGC